MIDIAFLGTGGNMPMPDRFLSSVLISYKGRKILLDCGEGTQVSMRMLKWGFKSIDIILITHEHGDHILGLPGLLSTIGNSGRKEPIIIIGPKGIKEIIEGLTVAIKYLPYEIYVIEAEETSFTVNFRKEGVDIKEDSLNNSHCDLKISTVELDHSVPCIGYSIYVPRRPKFSVEKASLNKVPKPIWKSLQHGESAIYNGRVYEPNMVLEGKRRGIKISLITDTRPVESIVPLIKDSSLLICEGNYGEEKDLEKAVKNKHMTFSEAAYLANKGEVKEMILTHFSPAMSDPKEFLSNARKIFQRSMVAHDRLVRTINFEEV